jgi:hypothetical protein
MVVNNTNFILFLKQFQDEVLRMPWKDVTATINPIKQRLDYIFSVYINIYSMTDTDIGILMKMLDTHKIHQRIKNLITSVWVCRLDNLNTYQSDILRQKIVDTYILKIKQ